MRKNLCYLLMACIPFASFAQQAKVTAKGKPTIHKNEAFMLHKASKPGATAAYCTPELDCTDNDNILNVTFGTINNTTTCSSGGYGDFTSQQTTVEAGNSYPISVTVGNGWAYESVSVWIDYNNNETFEASEFTYLGTSSNTAITGEIAVPEGTASGQYRMRVRVAAVGPSAATSDMACDEDQGYGETEDYTVVVGTPGPAGCLTAPNGQYPSATATPTCNGSPFAVTTAAWTGEYSVVSLTAGTAYTFASSVATHLVTIGDSTGTTVLAAGIGSVTYTPTTSGTVRFYTHLGEDCTYANTSHTRSVTCGTVPPPPTACEDFVVLSNNLENGSLLGTQRVATDLPIGNESFTIYGIEPTVIGAATSFEFIIYSDAAGLPGTPLETKIGTIMADEITGTNFGYDFHKYTIKFDSPFTFNADTTYWVEMVSDADGWESTSVSAIGSALAFNNENTAGSWVITSNGSEVVFKLICEEFLAVSNADKVKVQYYPNPVKDVLNITAAKTIKNVTVFNVAGQKMTNSTPLNNGQLNMSKFAPGAYLISVTFEDGRTETFKVLKH